MWMSGTGARAAGRASRYSGISSGGGGSGGHNKGGVKGIFSRARKMVRRTLGAAAATTAGHHDGGTAVVDDFIQAVANSSVDLCDRCGMDGFGCAHEVGRASKEASSHAARSDPFHRGSCGAHGRVSPASVSPRRAYLAQIHALRQTDDAVSEPPLCRALPMDVLYQFASYHGVLNPMHRSVYTVPTRSVLPTTHVTATRGRCGSRGHRGCGCGVCKCRENVDRGTVAWSAYHGHLATLSSSSRPRRLGTRSSSHKEDRPPPQAQSIPMNTKKSYMNENDSITPHTHTPSADIFRATATRKGSPTTRESDWRHRLFADPNEACMQSSSVGVGGGERAWPDRCWSRVRQIRRPMRSRRVRQHRLWSMTSRFGVSSRAGCRRVTRRQSRWAEGE